METMPAASASRPLRLLIVEDNGLHANLLRISLRQLGYEILGVAATGAEALRLFRAELPDLLLCDIHLAYDEEDAVAEATGTDQPVVVRDGIQLAGKLLAIRQTPLIFLTSLADDATFRRAQQVAPAAFLIKPFDPESLRRAIELAVARAGQPVQAAGTATTDPADGPAALAALPDVLFVRHAGVWERVDLTEVRYVTADHSYCDLHLANGTKYALHSSLRELESRLPAGRFVRIHRSTLVAWAALEAVDATMMEVRLRGNLRLPLGPSYRDTLLRQLPQLG